MAETYKYKYFSNNNNKEFRLYKDCQHLAAEIFDASKAAPKELRFSICRKMYELCTELIFSVRIANNYELGSMERKEEQGNVKELIQRIDDLLPVLRRCRCVSLGQESVITKRIANIKFRYEKWLDSDAKRIANMGK